MAGYLLIGALAAVGFVSAGWALFGWLLPGGSLTAVCFCRPGGRGIAAARRWRWLRDAGLLQGTLLAVDCGLTEAEQRELERLGAELCKPEALADRLELERN